MTRTAPSADRAIAIATLVAQSAHRGMTLSEITAQTGYAKSTCHSVLASLVSATWLVRHPAGPTYRLGPGFIALADTASRNFPALPFARNALREVCERTATQGTVAARAGNDVALLAHVSGSPASPDTLRIGQRLPLSPPLTGTFLAWSDPASVDAPSSALSAERRRRHVEVLAAIRSRGFGVGLTTRVGELLGRLMAMDGELGKTNAEQFAVLLAKLDTEAHQLVDLRRSRWYPVNHISAPVFDKNAAVAIVITVKGLPATMSGQSIEKLGLELKAAANAATFKSGGRLPVADTAAHRRVQTGA